MSDNFAHSSNQCDHTVEDIARVDGNGYVRIGDMLYIWGECTCSAPTIVKTEIVDVEYDGCGSIQDLENSATTAWQRMKERNEETDWNVEKMLDDNEQ